MDFQTFLQQFVNALSLGSLYALIRQLESATAALVGCYPLPKAVLQEARS